MKTKIVNYKYSLITILAISFISFGGIFVKKSALPPISTGFYRLFLALPFLFPFAKKDFISTSKKDIFLLFLGGFFFSCDLTLWNISFKYTTVANANLFSTLVPFTIVPISYFIFKEKISKFFLTGLIITLFGIFILMSGKINPTIENFKGDLMAFSTSFFYSLFLLTVYNARKNNSAPVVIFFSSLGGAISLFIISTIFEGIQYPKSFLEFLPLIGLALITQVLGQGILSYSLGKLNVTLASILVLLQPVIAAIYSYFIFKEILSFQEIIGIFIILIGIFIAKKGD